MMKGKSRETIFAAPLGGANVREGQGQIVCEVLEQMWVSPLGKHT